MGLGSSESVAASDVTNPVATSPRQGEALPLGAAPSNRA